MSSKSIRFAAPAVPYCVVAVMMYRRFQYDKVKQLFHRQKLARMIFFAFIRLTMAMAE